MPNSVKFELNFDKESGIYSPGENLSGTVLVDLEKTRKILSITLKLSGIGTIKTPDGKTSTEKYLEEEIQLGYEMEKNLYHKGQYSFPFSYLLSSDIPSTFIDVYNTETISIDYVATVEIVFKSPPLPMKHTLNKEKVFYVEAIIDLNELNPAIYHSPCVYDGYFSNDSKYMIQKMIQINVKLQRRAFVPGELIMVDATIDNKSSRDFFGLELKLVQTVGPNTNVLSLLELGTIASQSSGHLEQIALEIPYMKIISCNKSKLFKIAYYLVFSGKVWAEYYYYIPIIIGSKPYRRVASPQLGELKALRAKSSRSLTISESASNASISSRAPQDELAKDAQTHQYPVQSSESGVFSQNEGVSV